MHSKIIVFILLSDIIIYCMYLIFCNIHIVLISRVQKQYICIKKHRLCPVFVSSLQRERGCQQNKKNFGKNLK